MAYVHTCCDADNRTINKQLTCWLCVLQGGVNWSFLTSVWLGSLLNETLCTGACLAVIGLSSSLHCRAK